MRVLPIVMVVGALLAVVGGQAMLANGQVRMAGIESKLVAEQAVHRQTELAVSKLETPPRIVAAAISQLGLVHPATVTQLPYTPLTTPLPTPTVSAPPAATTTGATTTGATTTPTTAATTTTTAPGQ
jgi:hypothetical protein